MSDHDEDDELVSAFPPTKGEAVTTFRAVARHEVGADKQKIKRELLPGLELCVYELLEAGATISDVESAVECAMLDYDSDHIGKEAGA